MNGSPREYPARPLVGVGIAVLRRQAAAVQVLLIRRGRPPGLGVWSLPGGAQRLGETLQQAARRELAEETGLCVGTLHLAAVVDSIHYDPAGAVQYHYSIVDFAALWQDGQPLPAGDADAVLWAAEVDFDRLELWSEARRAIAAGRLALEL
jgi:ADP-ribose pyrophosphatase YjhB (NUDIX family)